MLALGGLCFAGALLRGWVVLKKSVRGAGNRTNNNVDCGQGQEDEEKRRPVPASLGLLLSLPSRHGLLRGQANLALLEGGGQDAHHGLRCVGGGG